MYFTVINRYTASQSATYKDITVPFIVVSISSHEEPTCDIPDHDQLLEVLYLKFDDKSYETQETLVHYERVAYPITKEDAEKLLQFIETYKNKVNDIIVHCEAGISRSTGTALALSEILNETNQPEKFIQSLCGLQHANKLVRDLILKIHRKINK